MTHLSGLIPIPAFTMPGRLTLVDLIVVVAIIGAFAGGLRHRRSLLAAAGSALGTALLCWIIAAAVVAWAPAPYRTAVTNSALAGKIPLPVTALRQGGQLAHHLVDQINPGTP